MKFKSSESIKNLEKQLQSGYSLPIFKGYVAVKTTGFYKFIDTFYSSLPTDLQEAKSLLRKFDINSHKSNDEISSSKNSPYDGLRELEHRLGEAIKFADFAIVSVKEFENLINKVYKSLPEEITKAEALDKWKHVKICNCMPK